MYMSRPTMNGCYWMQSGLKVAVVMKPAGSPARGRYVAVYRQEPGRETRCVSKYTHLSLLKGQGRMLLVTLQEASALTLQRNS